MSGKRRLGRHDDHHHFRRFRRQGALRSGDAAHGRVSSTGSRPTTSCSTSSTWPRPTTSRPGSCGPWASCPRAPSSTAASSTPFWARSATRTDPPGQMARWRPVQYGSRSSRLSSLPVSVRGNSSRSRSSAAPCSRRGGPGRRRGLGRQLADASIARRELDGGLDLLAALVVGDAEDGDVGDRRVVDQHRLDLGRVDVHAARDDHVDLAVAQEQVAVVVEVADVAEGAAAPAPGAPPRSSPGRRGT